MFPFLLLLTAITNIIIYLRTSNDIFASLGVCLLLSCLIWGLIIAHWSIHLLALLAILFWSKPVAVATVSSRYK
jgi:hypothetical protein